MTVPMSQCIFPSLLFLWGIALDIGGSHEGAGGYRRRELKAPILVSWTDLGRDLHGWQNYVKGVFLTRFLSQPSSLDSK